MAAASMRHQHPKGKVNIFSFRLVCRLVANHPFILVALLFLICLHLYFPFLFSLLVFASPVLICTAMLLGTLLIHGQPNDNNVIYHEEISNTSVIQRTEVQEYHPYSTKREKIFSKDRFAEVRKDIVEKGMKASGMLDYGITVNGNTTNEANWAHYDVKLGKGSKHHKEKGKNDFGFANFEKADVQLCMNRDYSQPFKGEQNVSMEEQLESSLGRQKHSDDTNNHESSDCESDGVEKSSFDALVADVIQTPLETYPLLDSEDLLHLSASRVASRNFELQSLDSNQSREDSSKDENYDDVEEHENFEAKDDRDELANAWVEMEKDQQLENLIYKTDNERDDEEEELDDDGSIEDVDIDNDDDDDDDEEEDNEGKSKHADKYGSKQVTMWTEEDEKNLRLVGNSEFERDLRLENLLARRRAKRNFSMISEKNLIDLDRPILPFQVAPISTTRVNPFDSPTNANYQHYNIPPIPGSAPISKQKRNPFDSPCTSPKGMQNFSDLNFKEEPIEMNFNNSMVHESGSSSTGYNSGIVERNRKDAIFRRYESFSTRYNFMDEASSQDFMETGRRDAVLRRHETFNTRSSFPNKLDSPKNLAHFKRRPFFVIEHVVGDEEERHSSMSHDSESIVSSSESDDHTEFLSTLTKHKDADAIKDTTEGDHASSHSEDTGSESSDAINSVHDDPTEEFMSSLEVNAELHANQISQKENESHDQNYDNASSNTSSVKLDEDEDHNSKTEGNDEDEYEIVNDYGLSPKASPNGTTEPPVFDVSPSGTEKSTPFSSTHS